MSNLQNRVEKVKPFYNQHGINQVKYSQEGNRQELEIYFDKHKAVLIRTGEEFSSSVCSISNGRKSKKSFEEKVYGLRIGLINNLSDIPEARQMIIDYH